MQNNEFGKKRGMSNRGRRNFGNRINNSGPRTNIYYTDNWVLKVFGFPEETTEDELKDLLLSVNKNFTVIQIVIRRNVHTHMPPTFALVEFEDFEEAADAFSRIDGINFKELKISAQFDRSSICTTESFYRNQCGRQNGSEPRRFQDDNNNNSGNNNSNNNNKFNERAEGPISRQMFNKNSGENEFMHPATSFKDGESKEGPTCSKIQYHSISNSNNLQGAWRSDCKYAFCERSHYSVHQQAESFQKEHEEKESSKGDVMEGSRKDDMKDDNYLQKVEKKFVVKGNLSNSRDKFDESVLSRGELTNVEDQFCSKSFDPNEDVGQQMFDKTEVLDETFKRTLEVKHAAAEETDISQHQPNIDQSSKNHPKETNPGFGPNSSRPCGKCGKSHGPHCPAFGKVCQRYKKINHFTEMCFSSLNSHHSGQRSRVGRYGGRRQTNNNRYFADKNNGPIARSTWQ